MPRMLREGSISFGLVNVPVRLYTAARSESISFNLIHAKCGSRIKQQIYCPKCELVIERSDLVKGYEAEKDQYVLFTEAELDELEADASDSMQIMEFIPLSSVDPLYYEKTYFLGPGKGGEKTYQLLAQAMDKTQQGAIAQYVMYGKENLVLIRAMQGGLVLHVMYYADEVRDFKEIDKGKQTETRADEMNLAIRLIDGLKKNRFRPDEYQDAYRERVMELIEKKQSGQTRKARGGSKPTPVIDLMSALKASLERNAPAKRPVKTAARGKKVG
ncbi:putative DNA repair protein, Ku type [Nitrospira sp. KM1]|uniref:non-homologous end joining protein Ku n=1 Tax=Nitrospira sp. KM1 TaxID=1936990 RepID=UPI0013A7A0D7|nr:Ku protein [Nitrospira sp. KM1]BCA56047.1 putative DNA repair protein, Ku type [Nitrospira sp. KM1]